MPTKIINGTPASELIQVTDSHDPTLQVDTVVYGAGGSDTIYGGDGNDWIWGSAADAFSPSVLDYFYGGTGDDTLVAWGNGSLLDGGAGNDVIIYSGPGGSNGLTTTLQGGDGDDQLWALNGGSLFGGNGNDTLVGGGYLDGGAGEDLLVATTSQTRAYGSVGDDTLYAGSGVTGAYLDGGIGRDVLVGNGMGDRLIAGSDQVQDVLIGGNGPDEFDIGGHGNVVGGSIDFPRQNPSAVNADVIWNFQVGVDNLVLPTTYTDPALGIGISYAVIPGYNSDLGLSGTLIERESFTSHAGGEYSLTDMVFLAGVTTDYDTLVAAGSLHFDDAVLNY
jgi:Ca2+-binding RTX toxin-like protein